MFEIKQTLLYVPEFRLSEVKVVDTVQVHVLGVPGKGRLPAAEVKVGRVHAVYLDSVVLNIRLLKNTSKIINYTSHDFV